MLKVERVNTYYGSSHILRDVSLSVQEAEAVGLLGRNGVGKTTLLKTITGLLAPQSGEVFFGGHLISRLPAYRIPRLGIAYVPQDFRVFPEFTVLENLEIGFFDGKTDERILEEVFEVFPVLKERKRQLSGTLSGGEKQMLAIARALVKSPRLLILDEPTEGLMPSLVAKVEEVLGQIQGRGMAVLMAEQNVEVALRVCDRIYVMEKGQIVYGDTSKEAAGKVEKFLEVGG